uniref:Uncharacterized protein n=1 Tax=Bactrocera latifrons TaxID=174628 RepID=A0A0K8WC35_BACLA
MKYFSCVLLTFVAMSLIQQFVCMPLDVSEYLGGLADINANVEHSNVGSRVRRQHYSRSYPGGYIAGGVYQIPGGVASYAQSAHRSPAPGALNFDYDQDY